MARVPACRRATIRRRMELGMPGHDASGHSAWVLVDGRRTTKASPARGRR
jgi:hypothetical protein